MDKGTEDIWRQWVEEPPSNDEITVSCKIQKHYDVERSNGFRLGTITTIYVTLVLCAVAVFGAGYVWG